MLAQWTAGGSAVKLNEHAKRSTHLPTEIVELLADLGLTDKDVEIYEYLLTTGGAIPSAIARDTGQPRGRIYEAMRDIVAKGFARERPTKPILFLPTPLPEVLSAVQARLTRHLHSVKHAQAVDAAGIASAVDLPAATPMRMRDVSVISGRRACFAEVTRMLDASTDFFWISGGSGFAQRLSNMPTLLEGIQAAAGRGVDVKVILPRSQPFGRNLGLFDEVRPKLLRHPNRSQESDPVVSCVTEQSSFEMIAQPDDDAPARGDDVAVQIAGLLFAQRHKQRLRRLIEPLQPDPPASVFPWLGPNHGSDIFGDAIKAAVTEVQVLGPKEWGAYMKDNWEHGAPDYRAAAERGVRLRAVATRDAAPGSDLAKFREFWDIRIVDELPMWLTIVDGREFYQAFPHPSLGGVPQFRRSAEAHELRFCEGIFEMLWAGGPSSSLPVQPAPQRMDDRTRRPAASRGA